MKPTFREELDFSIMDNQGTSTNEHILSLSLTPAIFHSSVHLQFDHIKLELPLLCPQRASLIAQLVKNPPAMQETLVQFLGWEDPLEKG